MLWVAGGLFLALRKLAERLQGRKLFERLWWLPFALLSLAVWAFAYAPLPFGWGTPAGLLGTIVKWVLQWPGSWIGVSASLIATVVLIVLLGFAAVDLFSDKKPDGIAKTAVYVIPILALVAGGSVAAQVLHFTHLVGNVGPQFVTSIAG